MTTTPTLADALELIPLEPGASPERVLELAAERAVYRHQPVLFLEAEHAAARRLVERGIGRVESGRYVR